MLLTRAQAAAYLRQFNSEEYFPVKVQVGGRVG